MSADDLIAQARDFRLELFSRGMTHGAEVVGLLAGRLEDALAFLHEARECEGVQEWGWDFCGRLDASGLLEGIR